MSKYLLKDLGKNRLRNGGSSDDAGGDDRDESEFRKVIASWVPRLLNPEYLEKPNPSVKELLRKSVFFNCFQLKCCHIEPSDGCVPT